MCVGSPNYIGTRFDLAFKRLAVSVSKLLQDIPEEKRRGDDMVYSVGTQITEAQESIGRATDTLTKASYLKRVAKLLEIDPDTVIKRMETLRDSLCKVENMRFLVIADVETLLNPVASWIGFVEGRTPSVRKSSATLLFIWRPLMLIYNSLGN